MPPTIRSATEADYPVFARLFPELRVEDPLLTPDQFAARMLPGTVIAEEGRDPVGYGSFRTYGSTAHVVHVVVDPCARGRGVGRALMDGLRARVRALSCDRWYLNVKQDNTEALRLYERCGLAIEE